MTRPASVSKEAFSIAGIITTVYGLEELPSNIREVACLWLLHPRLQTQECMEPIAASTILDWNARLHDGTASNGQASQGLIAVSFDQRNHGSREVDKLSNEAWRSGNPKHAQDMFSIYRTFLVVWKSRFQRVKNQQMVPPLTRLTFWPICRHIYFHMGNAQSRITSS